MASLAAGKSGTGKRLPFYVTLDERTRSPEGRRDVPRSLVIVHNGQDVGQLPCHFADRDRVDVMLTFEDGRRGVYSSIVVYPAAAAIMRGHGDPMWVPLEGLAEALAREVGNVLAQFPGLAGQAGD